ncbi:MAG: hypothetical protein AB7I09_19885 [Planctomycetota bacterium]
MRRVWIKEFDVEQTLKNKGIEFGVTDADGNHLGDFIITKARVEWCPGKKHRGNGHQLKWPEFIDLMQKHGVVGK